MPISSAIFFLLNHDDQYLIGKCLKTSLIVPDTFCLSGLMALPFCLLDCVITQKLS